MGRTDLACAECNCFLRLMVNLRLAVLSGNPPPPPPPPPHPTAQGRHLGTVASFAAGALWDFDPRFPHLKMRRGLDHGFRTVRKTLLGWFHKLGRPGEILG